MNAAVSFEIERADSTDAVNCGGHSAVSCAACPLTNCPHSSGCGDAWCNGDCAWRQDACVGGPPLSAAEVSALQMEAASLLGVAPSKIEIAPSAGGGVTLLIRGDAESAKELALELKAKQTSLSNSLDALSVSGAALEPLPPPMPSSPPSPSPPPPAASPAASPSPCVSGGTMIVSADAAAGDMKLEVDAHLCSIPSDSGEILAPSPWVFGLNLGEDNEEVVTVVGVGSLLLQSPLRFAHSASEALVLLTPPTAPPPSAPPSPPPSPMPPIILGEDLSTVEELTDGSEPASAAGWEVGGPIIAAGVILLCLVVLAASWGTIKNRNRKNPPSGPLRADHHERLRAPPPSAAPSGPPANHERVRNPHAGKDWVPLDVPEPDLPSRAEPSSYGMDAYNSRGSTKPATTDSGKERLLEGESNTEEAQKEFRRPTKTVGAGGDPYFQNIGPSSPRGGGAPTEQRMSCTPRLMSVPDLGGTSEMPPEPPPRGAPEPPPRGSLQPPPSPTVPKLGLAKLSEPQPSEQRAPTPEAIAAQRSWLEEREILSPEAEVGGTSDVPPPVPPRASAPAVPPLSIAELRMGRTSKEVSAEESITGKESVSQI